MVLNWGPFEGAGYFKEATTEKHLGGHGNCPGGHRRTKYIVLQVLFY